MNFSDLGKLTKDLESGMSGEKMETRRESILAPMTELDYEMIESCKKDSLFQCQWGVVGPIHDSANKTDRPGKVSKS